MTVGCHAKLLGFAARRSRVERFSASLEGAPFFSVCSAKGVGTTVARSAGTHTAVPARRVDRGGPGEKIA